jgi:hypothetical protein
MTAINRKKHRYEDKRNGIGGFDFDEHACQNAGECKSCEQTNPNPDHAKVESLPYHQTKDTRRRRAQSHPHSNLGSSLSDRSRKQAIHTTPARSAGIVKR